jgi:hypothetical protein
VWLTFAEIDSLSGMALVMLSRISNISLLDSRGSSGLAAKISSTSSMVALISVRFNFSGYMAKSMELFDTPSSDTAFCC